MNPLVTVVKTLVLYALAEAQAGHITMIEVVVNGDHFSVGDNGRGHAPRREVDGESYLKFIYSHLDYPFAPTSPASVQLQGLGTSFVNALCVELQVIAKRADATTRLRFENGTLKEQGVESSFNASTGNTISGRVASGDAPAGDALEQLREWCARIQATRPALRFEFYGEAIRLRAAS